MGTELEEGSLDDHTLKEVVKKKDETLQILYQELDEEREAAASAADEALAMIIRLQEEKASVAMEARHYKKMVEEKMHHAHELLDVFEKLMYQKEAEIVALEYQVMAYRQRLLSLGIEDVSLPRRRSRHLPKYREDSIDHANEEEMAQEGVSKTMDLIRRNISLPVQHHQSLSFFAKEHENGHHGLTRHREQLHPYLPSPPTEKEIEVVLVSFDQIDEREIQKDNSKVLHRTVYADEVPVFNGMNTIDDIRREQELVSSDQPEDGDAFSEVAVRPSSPVFIMEITEVETSKNDNNEVGGGVYDVFEVTEDQVMAKRRTLGESKKEEGRLSKPSLSKQLKATDVAELAQDGRAKLLSTIELYNAQAQLDMRMKLLEEERDRAKQEASSKTQEEFELLRAICQRLDTIQSQLGAPKPKKLAQKPDKLLIPLIEAMLSSAI